MIKAASENSSQPSRKLPNDIQVFKILAMIGPIFLLEVLSNSTLISSGPGVFRLTWIELHVLLLIHHHQTF